MGSVVLDDEIGAMWCWMERQVQCGAGWSDRCSVVLDGKKGAVWC